MLIFLRHGRTPANAQGLLQGRIDLDLDDLGRQQAAAAAAHIGPVDRVIASPLRRAQQTAAAFEQSVETDERFVELDYGEWEGHPVADVPKEIWQRWRSDLNFRPPGGETLNELGSRVRAALREIADEHDDSGTTVIVSHVSPIKASAAWALGVADEATWRMYLAQASICQVSVGQNGPRMIEFNLTSHLSHL